MAKTAKKKTAAKPASKKSTTKYAPTPIALVQVKGKPTLLVGSRRIAAHEGAIIEKAAIYWSQIKYVRVGKDKGGKLHITTTREAAAKGYTVAE